MGTYIVQSDIESKFGTDNVRMWSNLQNDSTTADSTRITAAISHAEQQVSDRFRGGMYALPFSAVGSNGLRPIIDWCAALAGAWLFDSRRHRENAGAASLLVESARKVALEEMDLYLAGCRSLDCAKVSWQATAPYVT